MRLRRFLLPHREEHTRAHAWHPFSFLVYCAFVLTVGFTAVSLPGISPSILGYASSITTKEIIDRTNLARTTRGIHSLKANQLLTRAAEDKAADMVAKDYWAHIAPDGTPPWSFITKAGYSYAIAGENLARNFQDPESVIDAWLASPSHRDNVINEQYSEIGVAVMHGIMNGTETTLVVQMFGKPVAPNLFDASKQVFVREPREVGADIAPAQVSISQPLLSPLGISKHFAILLLVFLGVLLVVDYVVLFNRGVVRAGGRNFAHLIMIAFLSIVLFAAKSGRVL